MNVGETNDLHKLLSWLTGTPSAPATSEQARDAAARLADRARRKHMAGPTGDEIRDRWPSSSPSEAERLRARVAELEDDAATLSALRAAGVDNWDGYDYAMELRREREEADE